MNLCPKNIVNSIVLLVGMLLCYNIYFEQSDTSSLVELNAENSSSSNFIDLDFEINEEDQIVHRLEFLLMVKKYTQHNHFHFTRKSSQPFYTVWQPPKFS